MNLVDVRTHATRAVLSASRVCQAVQRELVAGAALQKGDKSPVTVADFAAQAVVSHLLAEVYPDVPLVGEEDAAALRDPANEATKRGVLAAVAEVLPGLSEEQVLAAIDRGTYEGGARGRHFTLDPIDGTKGFLRLDQYAVALALIEEGEVTMGVLGCPELPVSADGDAKGCLFSAHRGGGATMRTLHDEAERPVRVAEPASVAEARLCESVERAHTNQSQSGQVAELLGITAAPHRIDSQCTYAAVARGDAHVYLRLPTKPGYVEKIWDHAAGWAVVTEAGGEVTDVYGKPLNFGRGRRLEDNKGVITTCGGFHGEVVAAVRQVLGL
jgi:3'(2'), 5'-bisphosphate nucleotidase